ncbi:MAG: hypothetical protein WCI77_00815 [Candidatus Omnitrophota bacterium]
MKVFKGLAIFFVCFSTAIVSLKVSAQSDSKKSPPSDQLLEKSKFCVIGKKINEFPFYVYKDGNAPENHFTASGLMGDFSDLTIDLYNKENPYSGTSCIKIIYKTGISRGSGWTGLYFQEPANNWGDVPAGYDLRKATKLIFWAKGQVGGETINVFQVGGISGKYGDTGAKSLGPVTLTQEWKQYIIDLHYIDGSIIFTKEKWECWPFMEPLSRIIGGFCWAASIAGNSGHGITFYLDEIRFEVD